MAGEGASSEELSAQLELQQQICAAMANCASEMAKMKAHAESMTSALSNASKEAAKMCAEEGMGSQAAAANELAEGLGELVPSFKGAGKAAKGFGENVGHAMDAASGGIGAVLGIVMDLASALNPAGLLSAGMNALIAAAAEAERNTRGARQAMQDLKGELGDLSTGEGAAAVGAIDGLGDAMKQAGVSGFSMFGKEGVFGGPQRKAIGEMAKQMGASMSVFQDEFKAVAGQAVVLNKALNMTGEGMKGVMLAARGAGRDIEEEMNQGMQVTVGLASKFGVSAKKIGKNLDTLNKDFSNFGKFSQKELAATAAYAATLGVEMGELTKLVDKFDNFDSAAQSAAKLSEAFGMNIDAMAMMNAENPAERMDMLRDSFMETGKTIGDLSRQELKYLEQQTGLTGEALANAFDPAKADISFDDMMDGADEAVAELSPEEAMLEAAKGIQKTVEPLQDLAGSLSEIFKNGFMFGFTMAGTEKMMEVHKNLQRVAAAGREAGEALGKIFFSDEYGIGLGLTDMTEGIAGVAEAISAKMQLAAHEAAGTLDTLSEADLTKLQEQAGGLGSSFEQMFIGIDEIAGKAVEWISGAIIAMLEALPGLLTDLANGLGDGVASETSFVSNLIDGLVGVMMALLKNIGPIVIGLMKVITAVFQAVFSDPKLLLTILAGVAAMFAWAAWGPVIMAALSFAAMTAALMAAITGVLDAIFPGFSDAVYEGFQAIPEAFTLAWEAFMEMILAGWQWLQDSIFTPIGEFVTAWWPTIKNAFVALLDAIKTVLGGLLDIITWPFTQAWNFIAEIFGWEQFSNLGSKMLDGIINGISNLGSMLLDLAKDAWNSVVGWFSGSPLDAPTSAGGQLGQGIAGGVGSGLDDLEDTMNEKFQQGYDAAVAMMENLVVTVTFMLQRMNEFIAQGVVDAFDNYTKTIQDVLFNTWSVMGQFEEIFNHFEEMIIRFVWHIKEGIASMMKDGMNIVIDSMEWAVGDIEEIFDSLPTKMANMIMGSMDYFFRIGDYFIDGMTFMMKGAKKAGRLMQRMMAQYIMPSDIVADLVWEANRIASMLHGMPHFNLGAKLKQTVGGMAIHRDVKIQHGDINIFVNFKVKMDTADVASTLAFNNKERKPYFQINCDRVDGGPARVEKMMNWKSNQWNRSNRNVFADE